MKTGELRTDRVPSSAATTTVLAEPALRCESLHSVYFDKPALKNVSCELPARQVTGILGPSGCGKSTFLKSLNRTLELAPGARVTEGRVLYRGRDIYGPSVDPRALRRCIGIVQQRPVVFPMSIQENVLFGLRFHGLAGERSKAECVQEYLAQAGLWDEVRDRLRDSASRLSIGQQQRLCIARALATQPDVLLMDEPCSALDPASTLRIEELIAKLKSRYTIVVVTHNMGQARRIADRCLFFLDGRLVEAGPTEDFFIRPQHKAVADFVQGRMG